MHIYNIIKLLLQFNYMPRDIQRMIYEFVINSMHIKQFSRPMLKGFRILKKGEACVEQSEQALYFFSVVVFIGVSLNNLLVHNITLRTY